MENNLYEDESSKIFLQDGVLHGIFKPKLLDLKAAKTIVKNRKIIGGEKIRPLLVDGRAVTEMTKEARDYFGSEEGFDLLSASALLVKSPLSSFLANFFLKINLKNSPIPIKVFTDREKALKWLENYK